MTSEIRALVTAFQTVDAKNAEPLGVMLTEDGLDVEALRILAAWQQLEVPWRMPSTKCPDSGRPTARAWAWFVTGFKYDVLAIASATGLSRRTTIEKLEMLFGARLLYPNGVIANAAKIALQRAIKLRLVVKSNDGGAN